MRLDHIINEKFEPISEFISHVIFYSFQYGEAQIKLVVVWLWTNLLSVSTNLSPLIKNNLSILSITQQYIV